jgi:multicomponent Na+:H+ antiporter subunit C
LAPIALTDQLVFLVTATILIFLGIGSMTMSKNLIKTIMCFQVTVIGANLALFASGLGPQVAIVSESFLLFSIFSGASVEAVGIAIVVSVHRKYGTLNPNEIRKLRG